ncbi:MAG: NADH-quinone oxidoreductase subunit J [Verrucomicrobia bacterium]|nr:NADH-quinone oxidoreductase subunit J [Verrucomicrobiota bacterium]MCF7708362.1 NADH-quinone oxidoreductase subunit J [Verrucomicrobiota bacterium]
METLIFYTTAFFILAAAGYVVTTMNIFRAAIGLTGVLAGIAGLYLLMNAQFLSAVQITVYVGGIMVLIVFAILLMPEASMHLRRENPKWFRFIGGVSAALVFAVLAYSITAFIGAQDAAGTSLEPAAASIREIGLALLSPGGNGFVLPFEFVSVVLIAALIGATTIAKRTPNPETKEEQE